MAEKTDDEIAREVEAVSSMTNAKKNMTLVLERVRTLEVALASAKWSLTNVKPFVPSGAYVYGGEKSMHAVIDEAVAFIAKHLPPTTF